MEYKVITQFTKDNDPHVVGRYVKVPKQCANCKYWECRKEKEFDFYGEVADGHCHRYPSNTPCISHVTDSGMPVPELVYMTHLLDHPVVYAGDWCGEFDMMDNPRWVDEMDDE